MRIFSLWVCIGVFLFQNCLGETPKTILALGDSITQGASSFSCYREFLVPELVEKDYLFIGPNADKHSNHAGFGGKNVSFLRSKITEIYREYPADMVLIHAGHNNFAKDDPVDRIVSDTKGIIEEIRKLNPDVVILLGQVIPSGKLPKYSYIPKLNEALASLADDMNVVLVNHAEDFKWESDTVGDKVHPNQSGAKKMAAKWKAAIEKMEEGN